MPRNKKTAQKLVNTLAKINSLSDKVESSSLSLKESQARLVVTLATASALQEQYNHPEQAAAENIPSSEDTKKLGWLTRHIDNRIKMKCRKHLETEMARLIALRKEKFPECDDLDLDYIENELEKAHKEILDSKKNGIYSHCKNLNAAILTIVIALVTATVVTAATSGAMAYLYCLILPYLGLGGYDVKRLFDTPKEYKNDITPLIDKVEKFVVSEKSFTQLLDESVTKADKMLQETALKKNELLNIMNEPAKTHVEKPHKHKHKKHHAARVTQHSMFANDKNVLEEGAAQHHERSSLRRS